MWRTCVANYFNVPTYDNPFWLKAAEHWLEYTRWEFEQKYPGVPVLVTTEILLRVLVIDPGELRPARYYYKNNVVIPPEKNRLARPLLPFFRHHHYSLANTKWREYAEHLDRFLEAVIP